MSAPIAYYTLVITGGINLLSAAPCLFKPWDMGVKMYMPLKLPTDERTIGQLSIMQAFMAVGVLSFSTMFIIGANICLSQSFVLLHILMLCVGAACITVIMKDENVGVDVKMCGMQLVVMLLTVVVLLYSAFTEDFDEPSGAPFPDISLALNFTGGMFILMNFAGIFMPMKLIEPYMPDPMMRPTDKYGSAQLCVFIRFASWVNVSTGALMVLFGTSDCDYYPIVISQLCYTPLFLGFFIAMAKSGLGFDDKPMFFWMIYISGLGGYFISALQVHSAKM